jgi:hypothetical protein
LLYQAQALEAARAGERRVADVKAKFGEAKLSAGDEGKAQVGLSKRSGDSRKRGRGVGIVGREEEEWGL